VNAYYGLALADIDGDSDLDLATVNDARQVSIVRNGTIVAGSQSLTGTERRFTYDSVFNQVTSIVDELGRQTLFEIDPNNGNVLSVRKVVGAVGGSDDEVTRYTYTTQGLVDLAIDPLGRTSDYDYDQRGRLTRLTTAKGTADEAIQRFEYDAAGNRTAVIDANGNRTEYQYDGLNRLLKVIEADPDGSGPLQSPVTTNVYDANGNLLSVTDARNFTTQYEYDTQDRLVKKFDPLSGSTQLTYDTFGNVIASTDELGHTTQFKYDSRNRRVEMIDAEGGRTWYRYDADNNLVSITDPLGKLTTYGYDARNRLSLIVDAIGGVQQFAYDPAGNNKVLQVDQKGQTTKFTYDELYRLVQTKDALGNVSSFSYDLMDRVTAQTDALGRTTTLAYDNRDHLTATIDPLGGSHTMAYDAVGNLLSVKDELNRTTTYSYDALNRVIRVTDPLSHTTAFSYDSNDNQIGVTDALGRTTTYTYDALNRRVGMTDALGGISTMAYDAAGNLISQTDALNRKSTFIYDKRNWLVTTTDPLNQTVTNSYNAAGKLIAVTDGLGHTSRYGYDDLYRQVSTTDARGQTTLMTYDGVGNLLTLTDPDQNKTSYTYDALDRQLTDTNQLGLRRTYAYDAVGNETSVVDRNGRQTTYSYNALNRQTQENWLDANNTSIRTTTRSYDAASQLTAISDPDSRYCYSYDLAGRLTSVDNTGTPGVTTVVLGYTYDAVNNKLSTTDTINGQLKGTETYTYDALNRVTRIIQSGNGVSNKRVDMSYDAASQRTGIARYSDLLGIQSVANSDYSYDLVGRLTRLTHKGNSTTYADYHWTYDSANRITQFISPDGTSHYNYDNSDQLTGTYHSYQTDENYSYDANGNRTNAGYQTGKDNRLLNNGTYSYTYDNEGNRTSRTHIATGEITQYTWDYHNRLTNVVTQDNSGMVTKSVAYTYDAYNRRIAKNIDLDGTGTEPVQIERIVYDGDNIALTFDGNGTQTHRYLYGPGVDQILVDEILTSFNWALTDNQGTVRDVIDNNGVTLNHLIYDSYGQVTSETKQNFDFRYGYTGRERDEETGLNYNRARYYDPTNGRFISEDPIEFRAGDINLYRYILNNLVNFIDPSGLEVVAMFNMKRGELTVGDMNRLKSVTVTGVFSGLKKFGINAVNNPNFESVPVYGPIPQGSYEILQSPAEGDWYRLDKIDNSPRDDSAGYRGSFRLHPGTYSEGCITIPENKYNQIDSLLRKTQTTTVQDRRKGRNAAIRDLQNKIQGKQAEPAPLIKRFGILIVY
jgi:RHS repeat-associated protein